MDNSSDRDRHRPRRRSEAGDTILNANTGSLGPVTIPITAPLLQADGIPGQTFLTNSTGLSFAFSQNENDCVENDCCTYTLELTRVTATVPVTLSVSVNGTLSVLAVGEEDEER